VYRNVTDRCSSQSYFTRWTCFDRISFEWSCES